LQTTKENRNKKACTGLCRPCFVTFERFFVLKRRILCLLNHHLMHAAVAHANDVDAAVEASSLTAVDGEDLSSLGVGVRIL
jgi:hypothetical protein